jgi:hypothetical protein
MEGRSTWRRGACGREGGLATGRFEDAAEAMAEVDRILDAQLSDEEAQE